MRVSDLVSAAGTQKKAGGDLITDDKRLGLCALEEGLAWDSTGRRDNRLHARPPSTTVPRKDGWLLGNNATDVLGGDTALDSRSRK